MSGWPSDFHTIRAWDGSQYRAFEELCYQLRPEAPPNARLIKTGDPDAGLEWYFVLEDGEVWGWQAKYAFELDSLLSQMRRSAKRAVEQRPALTRLTFCIPVDLPDSVEPGKRKSARERVDDAFARWKTEWPQAASVAFGVETAGTLLQRMVDGDKRGIAWFFWEKEVFSVDWCREQVRITLDAVGPRYTAAAHVDLPIAFVIDGLAGSERFCQRYRDYRGAALRRTRELIRDVERHTEFTTELSELIEAEAALSAAGHPWYAPNEPMPVDDIAAATSRCEAATRAISSAAWERREREREEQTPSSTSPYSGLIHGAHEAASACDTFGNFIDAPATQAQSRRALYLVGSAGQGKTHLFCDAALRHLDASQPAVVLLGHRFARDDPWASLAAQLGLAAVGRDVLVGAMEAAAEASNGRFLLFIDALNDADEPRMWQAELRAMQSALRSGGRVGLAVSCRSSYRDIVEPEGGLADLFAVAEHRGFEGREMEGVSAYFGYFGLELPRIPFIVPEFTNPLFLKLYCEGLRDEGLTTAPPGHEHLTAVFNRFAAGRAAQIANTLALDPSDEYVARACDALATALASSGRRFLERPQAKEIVDALASHLTDWPNTLYGQMLAEGLLIEDREYVGAEVGVVRATAFAYERFSDHLIVGSVLEAVGTGDALIAAFSEGGALREWALSARRGLIEALTVQLPERGAGELFDLLEGAEGVDDYRRGAWLSALLDSIVVRRRDTIGDRTLELLNESLRWRATRDEVFDTLLAVAADPDHPFNAELLHRNLIALSLPERDAWWSMAMYWEWHGGRQLERLLRWAAHGPHDYPDAVLELAAIPIVWMLSSPNRFARDFATKALVQLLLARLPLFARLLSRFRAVDDPYVLERLVVATHGAALRASPADGELRELALQVIDIVFGDAPTQTPNALTRASARGIAEIAVRRGVLSEVEAAPTTPPYGSKQPAVPRKKEWLEATYATDWDHDDASFGSLAFSVFYDDFSRYVISRVDEFSLYPLNGPVPAPEPSAEVEEVVVESKWEAFVDSLMPEQLAALAEADSDADRATEFLGALSDDQQTLLGQSFRTVRREPKPDTRAIYPPERAARWIFQRCIALGWRPELFGRFDRHLNRHGRDDDKPERFGKKYQWIALFELLSRLADNYHLSRRYFRHEDPEPYRGPWQWHWRDIDPSLPPAFPRTSDDDLVIYDPPFALDDSPWWRVVGPAYVYGEPIEDGWPQALADLPTASDVLVRTDPEGTRWIVLDGFFKWDEQVPPEEDRYGVRRRSLRYAVNAWLVQARSPKRVGEAFLNAAARTHLPKPPEVASSAYLGETPVGEAARYHREQWDRDSWGMEFPDPIAPATTSYSWEGGGRDCSLADSVSVDIPARELFELGGLTWDGSEAAWRRDGEIVALHRRSNQAPGNASALLVREDWLRSVLRAGHYTLVCVLRGEKFLYGAGMWSDDSRRGVSVRAVATLTPTSTVVGKAMAMGQQEASTGDAEN